MKTVTRAPPIPSWRSLYPYLRPRRCPSIINFRGRLVDSLGAPINGSATAQVKLFDAETGGQLNEETIGDIQLQQGNYSFQFGNITTCTAHRSSIPCRCLAGSKSRG